MTAEGLILEIIIILIAIGLYFGLKKLNYENLGKKFIILFIAVFLFELMSAPMWRNYNLNTWAYVFHDVSWIITLGWVNLFFITFIIVDKWKANSPEKNKFWWYLLILTIISVPIESFLLKLGIRGYSPILTGTFSGLTIPLTLVPIEIIPTVPIIGALVIGFYKYFSEQY